MGRSVSLAAALAIVAGASAQPFVNWESAHVHPMDRTPDGSLLLAVNTADNRLEVFTLNAGIPVHSGSVPVGLDPVTVRVRSNTEAWVVNQISDSVSIVDLVAMNVVETVRTGDEPADVVFAGMPERAFVSVSQENRLQVFDPAMPLAPALSVPIEGEDPRSLATDGTSVFVGIFESGNGTTIVSEEITSGPLNPYAGDQNPPPNDGASFTPAQNGANPGPPPVGMIVKKDEFGVWRDDNGADWSAAVTWDLHDHDVAIVDASTLAVGYETGLMNIVMGLEVRSDGVVTVIGTEATNLTRFEPNVKGTFVRVLGASFDPSLPSPPAIVDLNPHLDYTTSSIAPAQRFESIGDPRAIVWSSDGLTGYVAGMGSDNIAVIDSSGARTGRVDIGQGPTGLVLDESAQLLYALNKFDGSISVIDTNGLTELVAVAFFDPTPQAIKDGRPFLYNTQQFSGLGQSSCASCHIDGGLDQLAWDLGDPAGEMKTFNQSCVIPGNLVGCQDWHPMKGPMTTQTLVGLQGTAPFHWRADREDLAAFNPAFVGLLGGDFELTEQEMSLFNGMVMSMKYPPNPFRGFDGSTTPDLINGGDPVSGENLYFNVPLDGGTTCNGCHTAPTGTNRTLTPAAAIQETQDIKVPQLRNMYEKTGFDKTSMSNNRGFGYIKDGSVDTLFEFLQFSGFGFSAGAAGDQERRDVAAFMFAFAVDTHPAIGVQTTLTSAAADRAIETGLIQDMMDLADTGVVGLVVKGVAGGIQRGYAYSGAGVFQSDRDLESLTSMELLGSAGAGSELTFTVVPSGSETRIGVDRDSDGYFDRDELDACSDPADASVTPDTLPAFCLGDADGSGVVSFGDITAVLANWLSDYSPCTGEGDANNDSTVDFTDITDVLGNWLAVCP